ncbi:MAG: hypothetical protein J6Y30_13365 [Treponema sp.]|nr:hypothetical protein [Treponema sp.]
MWKKFIGHRFSFCKAGTAGIGGGTKCVRSTGREGKPRKARKKWPPCHFLLRVFCKNPRILTLRPDAPSMALLVTHGKNGKMFFYGTFCLTRHAPQKKQKTRPEYKTMHLDPTGLLFCKLQSPDFTGKCIQLIFLQPAS